MSDDQVRVPAGWYPDPLGLPQLRWWDNHAWTEHTSDARQPMVAETSAGQAVPQQARQTPSQQARGEAPRPRVAYADDLPYADDLADAADLADVADPIHDLVEPATTTNATDLPSRRTLRDAERLAHDDDVIRDLAGDAARFGEPLTALEAPARESEVGADSSPAARYARGAGIDDAPRSMRYDLDERHEDLLGEAGDPRSAFAHASSSTTTFIPDHPAEARPQPARVRGGHRASLDNAPRTSTVPAWLLALIPVYMLLVGMLVLLSGAGTSSTPVTAGLVLGVPWLAGVVLAILDHRVLRSEGMDRPAHWAWSLLGGPVYLVARLVATVRESGVGFGPVLTWAGLALFTLGSVVAVPGLVMVLAPTTFAVEAERSVMDDAGAIGADLAVDCPDTPPLLVQQSFVCRATSSDGDTFDVTVSLQRANGWIDWRVDDWGVFTMGS